MAYRAENDDLMLTADEQSVALAEFGYRGSKWADLDRDEQTNVILSFLSRHPEARPGSQAKEAFEPNQKMVDDVVARVFDALGKVVPQLIAEELNRIEPRIQAIVAQSESGVASSVEAAIAAAETASMAIGKAGGSGFESLRAELATFKDSAQRQLSRHAEHLAKLEDRTKRG